MGDVIRLRRYRGLRPDPNPKTLGDVPSCLDLGRLHSYARGLAQHWGTSPPFPPSYLREVEHMVRRNVKGLVSARATSEGSVLIQTKDAWGSFVYGFTLERRWFSER